MGAPRTRYQRILKVMNCESVKGSAAGQPLCQRCADRFPVGERLIYLNHAAVAPLSKPAADAMKRLAEDCLAFGSLHYGGWLAPYEGLREAGARRIGADRAADAMKRLAEDSFAFGSLHYGEWLATYEGLREAAARLIGAARSEIALVK